MKKVAIALLSCIFMCSSFSNSISTSYADSFDDLWIVSSLSILEDAPYLTGEKINAEFTIENKGLEASHIETLTIMVSNEDKSDKQNFYWYKNISINPGKSYRYKGSVILNKSGKYNFSIAYKTYGDSWEHEVKSESGIKNSIALNISENKNLNKSKIESKEDKKVLNTSRSNGENIILSTKFYDIEGHWAENFIKELVLQGVIKGYPDGNFYPDKLVTKSEFAVLLCKSLLLEKKTNNHSELAFLKNIGLTNT